MFDKERNALIPLPSGGLENIGSGPKSILSKMVSDALALARVRETSLAATRFRIGDYEFRDPDYRQILIWAEALKETPEVIVTILQESETLAFFEDKFLSFDVKNGSIIDLVWNFDRLPIKKFEWIEGLSIQEISFLGLPTAPISLCLPLLDRLNCSDMGLTELQLSNVEKLTMLNCQKNQLNDLDLSNIGRISVLICASNLLAELDLSNAVDLVMLECRNNKLVKLDLSNVPKLIYLWCYDNQLLELGLSNVPELTDLSCENNQITELDIKSLKKMKKFSCDPFVTLKKLPTQNF